LYIVDIYQEINVRINSLMRNAASCGGPCQERSKKRDQEDSREEKNSPEAEYKSNSFYSLML
jgi:hypothetical protein